MSLLYDMKTYKEAIFYVWKKRKELEYLTLLGNQGTKYSFDYAPHILEVI